MNFPERLKYLRKYYGYTQSTLAEKLGVTQGTVAMWETGKRRKCSVTNRRKRICLPRWQNGLSSRNELRNGSSQYNRLMRFMR